jgi:hypothetical protein
MLRRLETALLTTALLSMSAATTTGGATGARAITGTCAPKDERSDRLIANFKAFVGKTDMGGTDAKTPRRMSPAGRSRVQPLSYSIESTSSSMIIGGAFSSSIGITFDGVSGRGG